MSGACDRFEREGLLQLERGEELDSHFETCPDCRKARAEYERLGAELSALGTELEPPPDWQARTWARIARESPERRGSRWLRWLAPATAALAAAAVAIFFSLRIAPPVPIGLEVAIERGEVTSRSLDARPGDRLTLRAGTGGSEHAELRLYRDDFQLIARCSTEPPCHRSGELLEATFELPAVGSYQPLLLLADVPLPNPTGEGLDSDARRALEAGAHVELGDEIDVD